MMLAQEQLSVLHEIATDKGLDIFDVRWSDDIQTLIDAHNGHVCDDDCPIPPDATIEFNFDYRHPHLVARFREVHPA